MNKERIIEIIAEGKSLYNSEELIEWIEQSSENRNEYIRYKNLWALFHHGKEMSTKYVNDDFMLVKGRIARPVSRFNIKDLFKYAAFIILAVSLGYFLFTTISPDQQIAMNEISVPHGNRTLVKLPDGSQAWISNGSRIIYPESFDKETREIELEGEAFFTVKHVKKNPFIVNLGQHRIKVLGTKFSVVSYPDDNNIKVDLVSGKVRMDVFSEIDNSDDEVYKSYRLKPSYSLLVNKKSGKVNFSKIPDSFFHYWMNGVYEFKDETFGNLAKKIERIYGIEIFFGDESLKKRTFTGKFGVDDNIYTMMEVFKRASGEPFDYKIDRNKIYIKSKIK